MVAPSLRAGAGAMPHLARQDGSRSGLGITLCCHTCWRTSLKASQCHQRCSCDSSARPHHLQVVDCPFMRPSMVLVHTPSMRMRL
eukprot:7990245-Alexandrium_andersonii.AAC.1